jgi:hemin uptake protein HemP
MNAQQQPNNENTLGLREQTVANGAPLKKLATEKRFGGASEILMMHAGKHYLLAITKQKN